MERWDVDDNESRRVCKGHRGRSGVPTCTVSLVLNQQVLLFLTSGLLQLALVAVVLSIGATNLQKESQKVGCYIRCVSGRRDSTYEGSFGNFRLWKVSGVTSTRSTSLIVSKSIRKRLYLSLDLLL